MLWRFHLTTLYVKKHFVNRNNDLLKFCYAPVPYCHNARIWQDLSFVLQWDKLLVTTEHGGERCLSWSRYLELFIQRRYNFEGLLDMNTMAEHRRHYLHHLWIKCYSFNVILWIKCYSFNVSSHRLFVASNILKNISAVFFLKLPKYPNFKYLPRINCLIISYRYIQFNKIKSLY